MNQAANTDMIAYSPIKTVPAAAMDARLQECANVERRIRDALQDAPCRELRNIECEVHNETVRLSGHVSSYYLKQLAQERIARIVQLRRVCNQLIVVYSEAHAKPKRR